MRRMVGVLGVVVLVGGCGGSSGGPVESVPVSTVPPPPPVEVGMSVLVGCGKPGSGREGAAWGVLGGLYSCSIDPQVLCDELADGSGKAFNSLQALGWENPRLECARQGYDRQSRRSAPAPAPVPESPPSRQPTPPARGAC